MMRRPFNIAVQYLAAFFFIALGLGTYGCGDSATVSEGPPVRLSSLAVTPPGAFQPAFSSNVTDYRATVSTTDSSVVVKATPENSTTTMTIDRRQAGTDQGISITLDPAPSTKSIFIRITDQSGAQTTYVVIVTRPASSNTDLRSLSLSPGPLDPSFRAGTTRYTAQVGSGTARVSVTATLQDPTAALDVDGQGTISGQARAIDLGDPGSSKDITIVVTAPNGSLKSYLVTVVRAALGGNFNLGKLTVSPGTLGPSFKANTTRYTVNVGSSTDSVMVTATPQESSSTLQVNRQVANSGQARTIDLQDPGLPTDIEVLVIAQNGSRQPYVITVNRAALSADNNLEALSVSPGTLDPPFSADTTQYTVEVATGVTSVGVTATKSDLNAVLSGNIPNGGQANIPLDGPGTSKIVRITVAAPNGDTKTYSITVNRLAPSTDNNLSALTASAGTLTPAFSPIQLTYGASVSGNNETVTVSAVKSDPNAEISSADSTIAATGVQTGRVTVSLGLNTTTTVLIQVTAQDGISRKTYTINFFRPDR